MRAILSGMTVGLFGAAAYNYWQIVVKRDSWNNLLWFFGLWIASIVCGSLIGLMQ